jgi:hypothetical protein
MKNEVVNFNLVVRAVKICHSKNKIVSDLSFGK